MSSSLADRWFVTQTLLSTWWPPLETDDGVTSETLQLTEQHLHYRLPEAMREWYLLAGHRSDFLPNLVLLHHLGIRDNHLIFSIDQQISSFVEGIHVRDLSLPDPPVIARSTAKPETEEPDDTEWGNDFANWHSSAAAYEWITTDRTFSTWVSESIFHLTLGAASFIGRGSISLQQADQITQLYALVPYISTPFQRRFWDSHTLIELYREEGKQNVSLFLAARNRDTVLHIQKELDIPQIPFLHSGRFWGHQFGLQCIDVTPHILHPPLLERYHMKVDYIPSCQPKPRSKRG